MSRSKPKYLFIGLGTMGYSMAGHLSKLKDIDLFIFNRSKRVSKKWLSNFKGQEFIKDKFSEIKFNGLILCLKDDASILDILFKQNFIQLIKSSGFILDHSTLLDTQCFGLLSTPSQLLVFLKNTLYRGLIQNLEYRQTQLYQVKNKKTIPRILNINQKYYKNFDKHKNRK